MNTRTVVGARFMTAGRMYFFEPGEVQDLALNEWVVVQTELGLDAARVQILPTDSPLVQVDPPLGHVVRKASAADRFEMAKQKRREPEAAEEATGRARQRSLPIKILGADWQLDGANLTVFYSSEERADVGALAADLAPSTNNDWLLLVKLTGGRFQITPLVKTIEPLSQTSTLSSAQICPINDQLVNENASSANW